MMNPMRPSITTGKSAAGSLTAGLFAIGLGLWGIARGADKPPIISAMPAFWAVVDADTPDAADTRAARLDRQVIKAFPALYGPVIPLNPDFNLPYYFEQIAPLLPAMRELDARTRRQIESSLDLLHARVGRVSDMTIYLAPSLFTSNGQVRVVDGKPVVMFGVDVQAYAELELLPKASRYDLRAYVAHELFHAHHYGVNREMRDAANTLFDTRLPAPLYLNLWIEGLATCVSMGMDGDGSVGRALMSERLAPELPPLLPALTREYAGKLDARSIEVTRDYFWLGGERQDIPPRSAYAMGALVADDVLKRKGLAAALKLSGRNLRAEVGESVSRLSQYGTEVDWSKVCVAAPARKGT